MKAVILAAGEGTRLRPFTVSEPKVMIPVANKPILQFVIESLVDNGITDIIIVVGYRRERIMSYFGNGDRFGADIEYVTQWKQLGTAHSLLQTRDKIDDDFIVLPGDNVISEQTVSDLLKNKTKYSVLVTESETPSKYGVISMSNGFVKDIEEKPEKSYSHLISTGIYSFPPDIFEYIDEVMDKQVYDLTSVVQHIMKDNDVKGIITESKWNDAVYPWDLISVNSEALTEVVKTINGTIDEDVVIKGPVHIGEGAHIRSGTYIEGPAIIGEGCEIGPKACILPSTSIGEDSKISPFTVVHNSILMQVVEVGPNSRVENSVLGDGVKVGGNFTSFVDDADMKTESTIHHMESIGCMIAEDTTIGAGVVIEPGIIVGSDCHIKSGKTVSEIIPSDTRVM